MPVGSYIIAQEPVPPLTPKQKAGVKGMFLMIGTVLCVLLVLGLLLVLLDRQRKLLLGGKKKRKKQGQRPDAWSESGKRLTPPSTGDTADIDPEDIGPNDVEGDDTGEGEDEDDPHGDRGRGGRGGGRGGRGGPHG